MKGEQCEQSNQKKLFSPCVISVRGINHRYESHRQNAGGEESNVHPSPIIHHLSY